MVSFVEQNKMSGPRLNRIIRRTALAAVVGTLCNQILPSENAFGADSVKQAVRVSDLPYVNENGFSGVQPVSYNYNTSDSYSTSESYLDPNAGCGVSTSECCAPRCTPWWAHRTGIFGEVLYLNAGNSDLIYALEQTGPVGAPSPTGPLGISNIGAHTGFRVGGSLAHSDCSSLWTSFTRWDGQTTSTLQATGTNVIKSLVIHPSVATTGAASLDATAIQSATFQYADVALRRVYKSSANGVLNWNAGLRYGNMEQGLSADQITSVATGTTNVTTDIDFNGFGILGGLDGERRSADTQLFVYGRAFGSLLAGDWKADYTQTNQFGGGVIANTYKDFRVSPVVDTEVGLGWQNCSGKFRVTTGYLFSTWFNTVTTRDYIQSVRTASLLNMDDNLTFSGLTLRADLRF